MFSCHNCASIYLRESDAVKCRERVVEDPLIQVGKSVIGHMYGVDIKLICYSIKIDGHEVYYNFEWQDNDSEYWEHAFTCKGNKHLLGQFEGQINIT